MAVDITGLVEEAAEAKRDDRQEALEEAVAAIVEHNLRGEGPRITLDRAIDWLRRQGHQAGRDRVRSILRRLGHSRWP